MQHQRPQAFDKAAKAERDRQIIAAYAAGTKPADLASAYGISAITVRGILNDARRAGQDVKSTYKMGTVPLELQARIDSTLFDRLTAEAERRGMSVQRLCVVMLQLIAADDLYGAIIDDAGADFPSQAEGSDE